MPRWIAALLAALGLARRVAHVDAHQRFRLTLRVIDGSGAPVAAASVAVERPPEWAEQGPQSFVVGNTDPNGQLDAATDVFWAYETAKMPAVVWPRLELVVKKAGREARQSINAAGALVVGRERLLMPGDVVL
jgi:hypothetical protein